MVVNSDEEYWPPEDDPVAIRAVWYADDRADIASPGGEDYEGGLLHYGDDQQVFNVGRRADTTERETLTAFVQFNLTGIPNVRYTKAEFVMSAFATSLTAVDDSMQYYIEWWPNYGYGPGGEDYDPDTDAITTESGSKLNPIITLADFEYGDTNTPKYPDRYFDMNFFGANLDRRWAIPLNNTSQYRAGANVGFRVRLVGGEPTGRNQVFSSASYTQYDSNIDQYGLLIAGADLPSLRLWTGGETRLEANFEVGLDIEIRPSVIAEPLFHSARRRRNTLRR